jgi:hypothetical protein
MKRTARRLVALVGAAVLLVLALAAGPAAALTGALITRGGGRGSVLVTVGSPPSDGSRAIVALISAAVIALVAGLALAVDRRSSRRLAVAEGPAENVGEACDDLVCDWRSAQPKIEERKAA